MKKARKKRIVRRKRRVSERRAMQIKRGLMKRAKKLRLGAKRTGAYVYGTLRRITGNPLSYHVGGLSSLGAKRESQRRMRTYNQIKKSIQRGNASYGELAVLQSLAKEHPKLFAGDPMMAEAGGISEAQFRRLRGNPSFASLHPRDRATADKFVDYVYGFYGKGGLDAGDFGNRGFTRREVERAVAIYIDQIRKKKTQWGGGDSIDRERVRKILQPSYSFSFA